MGFLGFFGSGDAPEVSGALLARELRPLLGPDFCFMAEIDGEHAEVSWILEENRALRDPLDSLGFQPCRRWRLYEKSLDKE